MPSLKSHLVAFVLRHTRKKAFASPEGLHAWIAKSRKVQDHRPPIEVARQVDIVRRTVAGHTVYEVTPRAGKPARRLLYLHGGAYCFEMTSFHWKLVAEMCERLSAHISVPIYPLAPEHDFHAIYDMISKVYSEVVDGSRPVAIMGDSAGGNMALVLTMMAARQGLPVADRLVLISPTVDATLSDPRTAELARLDPWLDLPGGREAVRIYAADLAASDWRISPGLGDLTVLPPTQVFSGTRDLLHADTVTFADKAKAAGVDVELVVGKGMIHVWPLIDMPEAHRARDAMAAFLLAGAPFEATPRPPSPASPW